jgi:hypothetical protein
MHLPRWLLVSLIAVSGVALVAVPAWLWVEMPRRTAARFVAAIETNDPQVANLLLVDATFRWSGPWNAEKMGDFQRFRDFHGIRWDFALEFIFSDGFHAIVPDGRVQVIDRGFLDVVRGRQPMNVYSEPGNGIKFYALRDRVSSERAAEH